MAAVVVVVVSFRLLLLLLLLCSCSCSCSCSFSCSCSCSCCSCNGVVVDVVDAVVATVVVPGKIENISLTLIRKMLQWDIYIYIYIYLFIYSTYIYIYYNVPGMCIYISHESNSKMSKSSLPSNTNGSPAMDSFGDRPRGPRNTATPLPR